MTGPCNLDGLQSARRVGGVGERGDGIGGEDDGGYAIAAGIGGVVV